MNRTRRRLLAPSMVLVVLAVLGACGSSDDGSDSAAPSTSRAAGTTATTESFECTASADAGTECETPSGAADEDMTATFVAAVEIPAGTVISGVGQADELVTMGQVSATERADDAIVAVDELVGRTALEDIPAGEPLTQSMFG